MSIFEKTEVVLEVVAEVPQGAALRSPEPQARPLHQDGGDGSVGNSQLTDSVGTPTVRSALGGPECALFHLIPAAGT